VKPYLLEAIELLSLAHIILTSFFISIVYVIPIPSRCKDNIGFIPYIALVGGVGGFLKSFKTVSMVLLELLSNRDHLTIQAIGDIEHVYPLVGASLICFVCAVAVWKAFKSKYFPEGKTIK
jgi:fucose 4-O-acetylase-like acetyltransferase